MAPKACAAQGLAGPTSWLVAQQALHGVRLGRLQAEAKQRFSVC
jgi:hypothetical protein